METKPLILFDRSRVVTDWRCPRARYLGYEHRGVGVTSGRMGLELYLGSSIHDSLAAIAMLTEAGKPVDIDEIAGLAQQQVLGHLMEANAGETNATTFALEQAALTEGLIRGFYRVVWPRIMEQAARIRLVEGELLYEYDGLGFMSKPDLVIETHSGELLYWEYKSTSSKKDSWFSSWQTAVQLHSTIRAIETQLKEKVHGVVIQGLYKGYVNAYDSKQNSPLCYVYHKPANLPFTQAIWQSEYKYGLKKVPTWEMPDGVKGWVEGMDLDQLGQQFPSTPTIYINDGLIDRFFKQQGLREHEIAAAMEMIGDMPMTDPGVIDILDRVFPQKFDQCQAPWGRPCEFRLICHGNVDEPLEQGWIPRTPHHSTEADQLGEADGV